jgi:hypothetical protein
MSSIGAAPRAAVPLSPARAEASRRNGAKSRGPKTPEGKERSSQNALKHGLRAQKHIVLPGERAAEFAALEAALLEELAPQGALQTVLARRVVAAAWRLERAERLEADLFVRNLLGGGGPNLGLALIRDCNNARAFDTLLRYRSGTLAEFWRALRTLKALQAEAAAQVDATAPEEPIEPESRAIPGDSAPAPAPSGAAPAPAAPVPALMRCAQASARTKLPDEPKARGNSGNLGRPGDRAEPRPGEPAPPSLPTGIGERGSATALLAGTALVPPGRRGRP